jgi:hypothetical protein
LVLDTTDAWFGVLQTTLHCDLIEQNRTNITMMSQAVFVITALMFLFI